MKISTKLFLAVFVPVLLVLVVGATLIFSYATMEAAFDNGDKVRQIRDSITELNHLVISYITYREERPKEQFQAEQEKMTRLIAGARFRNPDQQKLLNEIGINSQSMKDAFFKLVSNTGFSGAAESNKLIKEVDERLVGQLLTRSHNADSIASALKSLVDKDIRKTQTGILTFIFVVLVLTTFPLGFILIRMRRSIVSDLTKLCNGTEVIRSGNLDYAITVGRNDEIGDLTQAFNRMTLNLKEVTASKADLEREMVERKRAEGVLEQRTLELEHLTETLEERVKERTAELADLSSRLVSAQEDERRRVSYDLHDNAWQALVAIRLEMEDLFSDREGMDRAALQKRSKKIMADLLEAVGKIRSMQGDLWPYVLDDIGILATVDWYCREFEKSHPGLTIKRQESLAEHEIPSSAKLVIYRILQETLSNVAKHSQARRVTLRLQKNDHRMEFTVEDNGLGFDPEEVMVKRSPWGGLGLLNLKARTELSGGLLEVESVTGQGTVVRAFWSLPEND